MPYLLLITGVFVEPCFNLTVSERTTNSVVVVVVTLSIYKSSTDGMKPTNYPFSFPMGKLPNN